MVLSLALQIAEDTSSNHIQLQEHAQTLCNAVVTERVIHTTHTRNLSLQYLLLAKLSMATKPRPSFQQNNNHNCNHRSL